MGLRSSNGKPPLMSRFQKQTQLALPQSGDSRPTDPNQHHPCPRLVPHRPVRPDELRLSPGEQKVFSPAQLLMKPRRRGAGGFASRQDLAQA